MILLILLIFLLLISQIKSIERFNQQYVEYPTTMEYVGSRCQQCSNKDTEGCLLCMNCGICEKNGKTKCIRGGSNGPHADVPCDRWYYNKRQDSPQVIPYYNYYPYIDLNLGWSYPYYY